MSENILGKLLVITLVFGFAKTPEILSVGISVRIFDVAFLLSFSVFLVVLAKGVYKVRYSAYTKMYSLYPIVVVIASIIGAILYGSTVNVVMGDIRWLQTAVILFMLTSIFKVTHRLIAVVKYALYITLFLNVIFVLAQIYHSLTEIDLLLLEYWYKESLVSVHNPGYKNGRFAGYTASVSKLGMISTITVVYAFLTKGSKALKITVTAVSCFLVVASGSRTSLVALISVIVALLFLNTHHQKKFFVYSFSITLSVLLSLLLINYYEVLDLKRFGIIIGILSGKYEYLEITSRDRTWSKGLQVFYEYFTLGSLVNPHVAIDQMTPLYGVVDSQYLNTLIRLSVLGPLIYIASLSSSLLAYLQTETSNTFVSISLLCTLVISIMSINAQTTTTPAGMIIFLLSAVLLSPSTALVERL